MTASLSVTVRDVSGSARAGTNGTTPMATGLPEPIRGRVR
jgi:hypothetical protein